MKILITSGGTSEAIDGVRKITNMSTGKLGAEIANRIVDLIDDVEIFFLSDIKLTLPKANHKLNVIGITDTNSVLENMKDIIESNKIDYVIHAMAISDYTVGTVFNENNIKDLLSQYININDVNELTNKLINEISGIDNSKKISSNVDNLFIKLVKTPKIVDMIKQLDPNIKLISFKLLNGVSEDELIEVATKQLIRTNSDLVVANDLVNIKNGNHRALFIKENGYKIVESKEQIATEICYFIINSQVNVFQSFKLKTEYVQEVLFNNKFNLMKNNQKNNNILFKVQFDKLVCDECNSPLFTYDADYFECSNCKKYGTDYEWATLV